MVDLKCKCGKCEHNDNCNCYARGIKIDQNTICTSYQKSKDENKAEYSDEIAQPLIRPSVDVICHADCIFLGQDNHCKANGITVLSDSGSVECSTFVKK